MFTISGGLQSGPAEPFIALTLLLKARKCIPSSKPAAVIYEDLAWSNSRKEGHSNGD